MNMREKLCSCSIRNNSIVTNISGKTAISARLALSLSSTAPPTRCDSRAAGFASMSFSIGQIS